jgi:hypothetical protein
MFERRIVPANTERLAMLDAALAALPPGERLRLETVVEIFVTPVIRLLDEVTPGARAVVVMQFISRATSTPGETRFLEAYYEPVRSRFFAVLREILPELTMTELIWRYNCMVGAMQYAMGGAERMTRLPKDFAGVRLMSSGSAADAIARLVTFIVAGFRAPPAPGTTGPAPAPRRRR